MVRRSNFGSGDLCLGLYAISFLASSLPSSVRTFQPIAKFPSPIRQRQPPKRSSSSLQSTLTPTSLNAVSQRQSFIVDGGELQSFLLHNNCGGASSAVAATAGGRRHQVGCLTLVTGTTASDDSSPPCRVVGVQKTAEDDLGDQSYDTVSFGDVEVYAHTMAAIPDRVSDEDAMSTAAAAVVGIHCAIPRVEEVGGSVDGVFYSGKSVVMGGNDYAIFLADGLATLGIDVSLVSTGGAKPRNKQVKVMQPAVQSGDDEIGFASAIGQFDSLIDSIANEQKGMVITEENPTGRSSVLELLRARHQCEKYISTLTQSQQIIQNDGVLFGPGKANTYVKSTELVSPKKCISLVPSPGFGPSTLQILLENNVLLSSKSSNPGAAVVRGWAMKDFWEQTSWPRDSSGAGVRFGLPVVEDEDLDELFRIEQLEMQRRRERVGGEGGMDEKEVRVQSRVDDKNPYVKQIVGVEGLAENIISKQKSSVVFVAMRSCRTCKGITPIFTKLARERDGGDLIFAKADATGAAGKALGKQLGVVAVPSFVLFRNGVRYGAVSASKLPSDKLDKAIRDLEAGEDFDTLLEEEDDQ